MVRHQFTLKKVNPKQSHKKNWSLQHEGFSTLDSGMILCTASSFLASHPLSGSDEAAQLRPWSGVDVVDEGGAGGERGVRVTVVTGVRAWRGVRWGHPEQAHGSKETRMKRRAEASRIKCSGRGSAAVCWRMHWLPTTSPSLAGWEAPVVCMSETSNDFRRMGSGSVAGSLLCLGSCSRCRTASGEQAVGGPRSFAAQLVVALTLLDGY